MMVLLVLTAIVSTTGCEGLRKKFVRKKKSDVSDSQSGAILDPIEYPAVVKTSSQSYSQHYDLWKVWIGDLKTEIEEGSNEKKIQGTLDQMKIQLTAIRNQSTLLTQIRSLDRRFKNDLALPHVYDHLAVR